MFRKEPDEFAPIGELGVIIEIMGIKTFLGYTYVEDIAYTPYGQILADEFVSLTLKTGYPEFF